MGIFEALKNYRDRMDVEKSSMRMWTLSSLQRVNNSDLNLELKTWCVLSISISEQIYEFFIDNYRKNFKGTKADGGLKEIINYLLFHTLSVYGNSFKKQVDMSDSEISEKIGYLLDFSNQTYHRLKLYQESSDRNISAESKFLLFSIISETNPSMDKIPVNLEEEFGDFIRVKLPIFNKFLELKGFYVS